MPAHIGIGGEPRCAQYLSTGSGRSDLSLNPGSAEDA
jgi:hypothetical protein